MANQIIPLSTAPAQSLQVALSVDGRPITLRLTIRYNEMAGYWVMAIADSTGVLLLDSIPLVTGSYPAANLLQQYAYLGIGSAYIINASGVAQDYPNATDLGSDFVLLWGDTPAV